MAGAELPEGLKIILVLATALSLIPHLSHLWWTKTIVGLSTFFALLNGLLTTDGLFTFIRTFTRKPDEHGPFIRSPVSNEDWLNFLQRPVRFLSLLAITMVPLSFLRMIMYHSTGSKWAKAAAVIIHTIFSIFALLPQLDLMISETPQMGHGDLVIDMFFMPIWSANILLAMLAAILPVYFQTRQGARLRGTNNPPALTYTGLFSDVCLILQIAMSWKFCTSWPWRIERISQVSCGSRCFLFPYSVV
ncbi:hypothetical protein BJX68DRAFT_231667 [Aspergillus pseudodeflectus]|uniref:CFEM domain-containing protein n=1 Tax=Aspergillus pseudodeflectus TaxID=176178 RepID=A0ABR4KSD2_9EURO